MYSSIQQPIIGDCLGHTYPHSPYAGWGLSRQVIATKSCH